MPLMDPHTFENRPPILLTEADRLQLAALAAIDSSVARFLQEELSRAETVAENIAGLVTMGSTVKYDDHRSLQMQYCKLVYPDQVVDAHSVSVLSVLGVALLGLSIGQSMTWIDDTQQQQRITVLDVT